MPRVLMREVTGTGFGVESVAYGTESTERLEIGGIVKRGMLSWNENKETYVGIGGTVDTKLFYRKRRDVEFAFTYIMKRDGTAGDPTQSLTSLFLGDEPPASGTMTLRPNTTNNNLRSATIEIGYNSSGVDRYYQVLGCMGKMLRLTARENIVEVEASFVAQDFTVSGTPSVALPSEPTVRPFDPEADATWTFANPPLPNPPDIVDWEWRIENTIMTKGTQSSAAGRTIGEPQLAGRKTELEMTLWRNGHEFEDQLRADPATSSAEIDITVALSKGSEFYEVALTDAQIVSPGRDEFRDEDDTLTETYTFIPKTYTVKPIAA